MKKGYKEIKGYEGHYGISEMGRVWSSKSKRHLSKVRKANGYWYVSLKDENGKTRMHFIHRLVAIYWLPNPNNLPQVNHINGRKNQNSIKNVEWICNKRNMAHAHAEGLVKCRKGKKILHLTEQEVKRVYLGVRLDDWSINYAAKFINRSRTVVSSIINKRSRKAITDLLDEEYLL